MSSVCFKSLPNDVCPHIFNCLSDEEILTICPRVSKAWRDTIDPPIRRAPKFRKIELRSQTITANVRDIQTRADQTARIGHFIGSLATSVELENALIARVREEGNGNDRINELLEPFEQRTRDRAIAAHLMGSLQRRVEADCIRKISGAQAEVQRLQNNINSVIEDEGDKALLLSRTDQIF
jgi:hypothetical protein